MKAHLQEKLSEWRLYFVIIFILLIVTGLLVRLVYLTVINQRFLNNQGNVRAVRTVMTPAFRGMILDRNRFPLAVSSAVFSVWIDPKVFQANNRLKTLSNLLEMPQATILKNIREAQKRHRGFLYLQRSLSPETASKIKALQIPGVHLQEEFKRFYPEGEVAAHVIGFTNVDDQGQEGLELLYNKYLAGVAGKKVVLKDRIGREISAMRTVQTQQPGQNIQLSIDRRLQYLAYRELMAGVQENKAASASVVILDVKTGEVLAMVNQPSFNPNNRLAKKSDAFRNRAVTDTFEPGSTIKAFTIASGLQSGLYKPDTLIDTNPGWIRVMHHVIRDEHNAGVISVTRALQLSSDVAVIKIGESLPENTLWNLLHNMGFGETTGIAFPGEESGKISHPRIWTPLSVAALSFGYSISVNTLQLARAYAAIANHGVLLPVSLLKVDAPPKGEQVMNPKVADQMLLLLETVVGTKTAKNALAATGIKAAVPNYRVAGKTGTARLVGENGYEHRYTSSFVGMAPVSNPRLVVAVVLRDPQGKHYYGAEVSAPIFERIMEGALRILNVPPDNVKTQ